MASFRSRASFYKMVEADPESVRDLLMEDGFTHWRDLRIYPVTPTEDIMQRIDNFPSIY